MSPQPHDGPAEEGHSTSTLRAVEDPKRVESLRQVLSSFNHRCRNSLNGIKMSLYLIKREVAGPMPGHWSELERTYQELEVFFDRLQVIYRPLSLTLVHSPFGLLIHEHLPLWRSSFSARGRTLEVAPPADDLAGDFDPMYLGLALDAFVAWRAESGRTNSKTVLSWKTADGFFDVRWEEGTPGNTFPEDGCEEGQLEGSSPNGPVDSLAQPLLKRIVAAHGGLLKTTDDSNMVITLRWPQFQAGKGAK
jgi:hypothetical protein